EQRLAAIAENQDAPDAFLSGLIDDLHGLLGQADADRMRRALSQARGVEAAGATRSKTTRRRTASGRSSSRSGTERTGGAGRRRSSAGRRGGGGASGGGP
ncbi:MAG TPA: DNA topoisomerase III, partial [Halomonas sp.]|nr:DNA topoisomerase III [Halomonas sp.]